jgi:integrase
MTKVELEYLHMFVDRLGHVRCYFRYRGKRWPLPLPHDSGFATAYEARMKMVKEGQIEIVKVAFIRGSLGWAIEKFMGSTVYADRAEITRKTERPLLDHLRRKYGAGLLRDLTSKHIKLIRNEIAREHSTSRAQTALGLLSTVWEFADEHLDLDLAANPRHGISRIHKVRRGHEPWPEAVIEAFDKAAPPRLRLAMKLALYTGQRRSDLVLMDWSRFDGKFIEVRQQKTDELLSIPCHKELRAALGRPGTGPIITNAYGKAYSTTGLSNAFHDVLLTIGGKGSRDYGDHRPSDRRDGDAVHEAGEPETSSRRGDREMGKCRKWQT